MHTCTYSLGKYKGGGGYETPEKGLDHRGRGEVQQNLGGGSAEIYIYLTGVIYYIEQPIAIHTLNCLFAKSWQMQEDFSLVDVPVKR